MRVESCSRSLFFLSIFLFSFSLHPLQGKAEVYSRSSVEINNHNREIARAMARQMGLNPASSLARQSNEILFRTSPQSFNYENKLERLTTEFKYLRRLRDEQVVLHFLERAIASGKLKADARVAATLSQLGEAQTLLEAGEWSKASALVTKTVDEVDRHLVPDLNLENPDLFYGAGDRVIAQVLKTLQQKRIKIVPVQAFEKIGMKRRKDVVWGYRPLSSIRFLVIHHTVQENLKEIFSKHTEAGHFDEQGAPFISYHFMVMEDGTVISLNHLEDKVWHAREANFYGVGIAMIGNREEKPVPSAQARAMRVLVGELLAELHLSSKAVQGHGDLKGYGDDTVCPGRFGRELMKSMP